MIDSFFGNLFGAGTATLSPGGFVASILIALAIGLFLALVYMFRNTYTRSFVVTLAVMPAIVSVVIMMVNGNIGAGVAVMGAFSLVRFRSVAGSAKEIGTIFLAMATGLVVGMGYAGYAVLFALVMGAAWVVYQLSGFGSAPEAPRERTLKITVPEDLNFTGAFDDLFEKYCVNTRCTRVKTTNMGSLYKLTYDVILRNVGEEKAFIDELRCRNGNLEISLMQREEGSYEL